MSPTKLVIRGLLAVILMVAFVIVCLWWYYRPTIEAGSGLSSRTESISIPSISIGITNPYLLMFLVVVVVLFAILKFLR